MQQRLLISVADRDEEAGTTNVALGVPRAKATFSSVFPRPEVIGSVMAKAAWRQMKGAATDIDRAVCLPMGVHRGGHSATVNPGGDGRQAAIGLYLMQANVR